MALLVGNKENLPQHGEQMQGGGQQLLSSGELKMMLGQCLKMASENKITAHNTWSLPLIEHLDDLIKDEHQAGRNTNFQKASVTLDAGVKIYSYRVDSVHTETFKMLGGLGRASIREDDQKQPNEENEDNPNTSKKRAMELQPEATLEQAIEALNLKKIDLAFDVDPLFHKTSSQFDEGGAHGLLLTNLSTYTGCKIVFDSMETPDSSIEKVWHAIRSHTTSACIRSECQAIQRDAIQSSACIAPSLGDIRFSSNGQGSTFPCDCGVIINNALSETYVATDSRMDSSYLSHDTCANSPSIVGLGQDMGTQSVIRGFFLKCMKSTKIKNLYLQISPMCRFMTTM